MSSRWLFIKFWVAVMLNNLYFLISLYKFKHFYYYLFIRVIVQQLPLWSSGQSSWLQIQRSRLDSGCYQIFWEIVGLEHAPPSLVSTIEELLEWKSSGSSLENKDYGCRGSACWLCDTSLSAKVGSNFADKRRSLGQYNSLADSDHSGSPPQHPPLIIACFRIETKWGASASGLCWRCESTGR
jgi:hypothetical protein